MVDGGQTVAYGARPGRIKPTKLKSNGQYTSTFASLLVIQNVVDIELQQYFAMGTDALVHNSNPEVTVSGASSKRN